jgi:hypothetical protein
MQHEYIEEAKKALKQALKIKLSGGWSHVITKEHTELYRKEVPKICPIPCYLFITTINKLKDELINNIWNTNEKTARNNDPNLIMWEKVEQGDNWQVYSQHNAMVFPLWTRHSVFSQSKFEHKNVTYIIGHSVDHPNVEYKNDSYVRTHVHFFLYEYTDNGDNTTSISCITLVDPKGNIPVFLIDIYTENIVNMFNLWKK